jgi:GTP-binding protein
VDKVEHPKVEIDGPTLMQVSSLDYSSYVGAIAVGRISRGVIRKNQQLISIDPEGKKRKVKIGQVLGYMGLERNEVESASAGDIIAVTGIGQPKISDTLCDPDNIEALPPLTVDEPTVTMTFQVNTSPFVGKEGKLLTSRQIFDRLQKELIHNVALRVEQLDDADKFKVSGRGELHLSVLIETMRREGFEMAVSRPEVIMKEIDGVMCEPYENVTVDIEEAHQGTIMESLGLRKAEMRNMQLDGAGRVRLDFFMPSRGLIGFQTEFMTATSGTGLIYHTFDSYAPAFKGALAQRRNGVMIANAAGKAVAYALWNFQDKGRLFIGHGTEIYEGMIIGSHNRDNDLTVNAIKGKQLTNVRASGTDEATVLSPHITMSLEQSLEFIDDDELVEVTPKSIRIRKRNLTESERRRAGRIPKDKK